MPAKTIANAKKKCRLAAAGVRLRLSVTESNCWLMPWSPASILVGPFVDDAALHDEADVLEQRDVLERIAVDGDDVGEQALRSLQ